MTLLYMIVHTRHTPPDIPGAIEVQGVRPLTASGRWTHIPPLPARSWPRTPAARAALLPVTPAAQGTACWDPQGPETCDMHGAV